MLPCDDGPKFSVFCPFYKREFFFFVSQFFTQTYKKRRDEKHGVLSPSWDAWKEAEEEKRCHSSCSYDPQNVTNP